MTFSFISSEEFDERAHQLYDSGEYDQALDVLREGLRRYPDSADLHVGLGYVRLAREEFVWAYNCFQQALTFDADHEDGWVGTGETLLKFGRVDEALNCFAKVDDLGLGDDPELGLAIGRALYREGMYRESRERLVRLAKAHADTAEVRAALAYTLHALGDDLGARRELRAALKLDEALHEVRIYLSHLLFERGDLEAALREMERVPPAEHWDPLSLWRYIELKGSLEGHTDDDPALAPWRDRWLELQADPDPVDHLLAEVEAAFEESSFAMESSGDSAEERGAADVPVHRVRTADGRVFVGTWEEIVVRMRDELSDPAEPLAAFMRKAAQRVRNLTGRDVPHDDAEAFLRESARIGLIEIES
ncbi:MAG: tetratricopeptide repeat protein [Gemmatimonadetes bacterium]|nr:tetratricopeptide repeat protein [Gemmatimonadota bacterium]